ncbi:MAG TPA: shikimate dehydrogenase [Streptosporangiaceae bacterium]|nr:shikimate dehydrogenase [Streptosporangiaceae bacterium]
MAAAVPGLSQEDRRSVRAAVLGSPISHSLSPVLHNAAYAALGLTWWRYEAIECDEAGLPALLDRCGPDWAGLSLTMPLKRSVLPLLDRSEPLVTELGGANTVIFAAAQRLGYNTDVPGMVRALAEHGIGRTSTESVGPAEPPPPARPDPRCQALPGGSSPARPDPRSPASPASTPGGGPVLILGGGATACAALAALRELGERSAAVAVRDPARASDLRSAADRLGIAITLRPFEPAGARGARLIISTVPAGAADVLAPLFLAPVSDPPAVLDVVYHPWPTRLAVAARQAGAIVVSGFDLLLHQAAVQVELMTGRPAPVDEMRRAGLAAFVPR